MYNNNNTYKIVGKLAHLHVRGYVPVRVAVLVILYHTYTVHPVRIHVTSLVVNIPMIDVCSQLPYLLLSFLQHPCRHL